MVCYRVIVASYVRSVGHVFAYFYIMDDDSECPMDYETSLLPNFFSACFPANFGQTSNVNFLHVVQLTKIAGKWKAGIF